MKMMKTIPAFPVINIDIASEFYRAKMGYAIPYHNAGFAKLIRDEVELHLWASSDEKWKSRVNFSINPIVSGAESFLAGTASCRIEVQGIDTLFAEYKLAEVLYSQTTIPEEKPWGTKEFPTLDLHGNLLTFFERIGYQ